MVTLIGYNKSPLEMSLVSCTLPRPSPQHPRQARSPVRRLDAGPCSSEGLNSVTSDTETRPSSFIHKGTRQQSPCTPSPLQHVGKPPGHQTMGRASVSERSPCPGPRRQLGEWTGLGRVAFGAREEAAGWLGQERMVAGQGGGRGGAPTTGEE